MGSPPAGISAARGGQWAFVMGPLGGALPWRSLFLMPPLFPPPHTPGHVAGPAMSLSTGQGWEDPGPSGYSPLRTSRRRVAGPQGRPAGGLSERLAL